MQAILWVLALICTYPALAYALTAVYALTRGWSKAALAGAVVFMLALAAALAWGLMQAVAPPAGWLLWDALLGLPAWWTVRRHVQQAREAGAGQTARAIGQTLRHTTLHLVLLSGAVLFCVPFAWLVVTSLKEDEDMSRFPPVWIPRQQVKVTIHGKECGVSLLQQGGQTLRVATLEELETGEHRVQVLEPPERRGEILTVPGSQLQKVRVFAPKWENYWDALRFLPPETNYGLVFLWNTLFLSILSIIGTVLSSSLVAFAFSRLRWPGRDIWFVVLLATMMVPGAVTMLPVFVIFRALGWVDTLRPLWVPAFFGSAFNIFLLRQFFLTIPTDLEDAAKIDGCSYFGIYWRIMLPLIKPALAAVTIWTFMGAWNNFMGPLIYISSPEKMPLAYALQLFQSQHGGEPGMLMAAATMVMLPVLVLFFFTQRYFIEGVTLTGIKG
ncbi:MAG: carbohydrate ABC transporter permease [Armatimonadota bacterium]|nr:carbohydrate ABC transporter permease [bacterium]MDW8290077.1 carbohydrate ABC transporter permease [Armatimonadota bacterium]